MIITMLPIICKGKGLIPRVGMIAPVFTPFKVDLQTLTIIMKTPGSFLKPYFVDPETSAETMLTNGNWKGIYQKYEERLKNPKAVVVETKPDAGKKDDKKEDGKSDSTATITTPPMGNVTTSNPAVTFTATADASKTDGQTESDDTSTDKKKVIEGEETTEDDNDLTFTPITKPDTDEDDDSSEDTDSTETGNDTVAQTDDTSKTDASVAAKNTGNQGFNKYNNNKHHRNNR